MTKRSLKKSPGIQTQQKQRDRLQCDFWAHGAEFPLLVEKREGARNPLSMNWGITHHGRTETVNRALTDFGIEDSFAQAGKRFEKHYGFNISASTVDRVTKDSALECQAYLERRLSSGQGGCKQISKSNRLSEPMLVELDGCEIRTGTFAPGKSVIQTGQPHRTKSLAWRDIRVGLARPMSEESKLYVAQMEKYLEVVSQLFSVAAMLGMAEKTGVVAVADGGQGLREELENEFPTCSSFWTSPTSKNIYTRRLKR